MDGQGLRHSVVCTGMSSCNVCGPQMSVNASTPLLCGETVEKELGHCFEKPMEIHKTQVIPGMTAVSRSAPKQRNSS